LKRFGRPAGLRKDNDTLPALFSSIKISKVISNSYKNEDINKRLRELADYKDCICPKRFSLPEEIVVKSRHVPYLSARSEEQFPERVQILWEFFDNNKTMFIAGLGIIM
jgi:hypothetical protein